jgi:general secretion pathway protein C
VPRRRTAAATATPPDREALADRVRQLNENRFALQREDVEAAARNPAALFSQARILPKYEEGQMVGVQLNAVKPGSVFEQIGIRDGDIVVEFNGTRIESPQQSAELMRQLSQTDQLNLRVEGADGQERTLTYTFE